MPVILSVVPVATPFVHQVPHVVESIAVGTVAAHGLRPVRPRLVSAGVRVVPPRVSDPIDTAECCLLAFRFGRQTAGSTGDLAQPGAVRDRVEPGDRHDRLLW
jgi:hypothetical protein